MYAFMLTLAQLIQWRIYLYENNTFFRTARVKFKRI